jgi:GT2 family glycosyltransferase
MAFLCKEQPTDLNIILVDGSPVRDDELAQGLERLGVEYLHCGKELSATETVNAGIMRTKNPVVVYLTNDVFIQAAQVRKLAAEVRGNIACAFPYLTSCDYGTQIERRLPVPRRCYPSRMVIVVAAFSREALEKVGLMPTEITGVFCDVILSILLREEGYSLVLRNVGHVIHLGQQTLKTGASTTLWEPDAVWFAKHYPQYWRKGMILFHKVAQRTSTKIMYFALEYLPVSVVNMLGLERLVWQLEPYLCAEKGTYREGVRRILGMK